MVSLIGGSNINAMEVRLSGDATDLNDTLDDAATSIRSFKAQVAALGTGMAIVSGAGMAAATKAAMDWNEVQREMQKVTNAEVAEELGAAMREMSRTIPIATNELGMLAADAARFGIKGPENIEAFTRSVAKMTAATDLMADEAGEAFAKLGAITETPATKMENLGSAINSLSNNMATSSSEIVEATLRSAASMSNLGASQTEIVALGSALNEVNSSARRAGTGLRRVAQELMSPSNVEGVAKALDMTGEEFRTMRDEAPVDTILRLAEVMKEGGKRAEAIRGSLSSFATRTLSQLGQNLDGANRALERSGKAFKENKSLQREFEIQTDSLQAQLRRLINSLRDLAITVGNEFIPVLKTAIDRILPVLDSLQEWVEKAGAARIATGLLVGMLGGLALALGAIASIGPPVTALLVGIAGATAQIVASMAPAVVAVSSLALAFKKNFAGVRDAVMNIIKVIRDEYTKTIKVASQVTQKILSILRSEWEKTGVNIQRILSEWVNLLEGRLITAIRVFGSIVRGMLRSLVPLTVQTIGVIKSLWAEWGDEVIAVKDKVVRSINVIRGKYRELDKSTRRLIIAASVLTPTLIGLTNAISLVAGNTTSIIGPLLSVIGSLTGLSSISSLLGLSILPSLSSALAGIGTALTALTGPLGAVILLVGVLATAWALNLNNIQQTTITTFNSIFNQIKTQTRSIISVFRKNVAKLRQAWKKHRLGQLVRKTFTTIKAIVFAAASFLSFAWNTALKEFRRLWNAHGAALFTEIKKWVTLWTDVIIGIMDVVVPIIRTGLNKMKAFWTQHGSQITTILRALWTIITGIWSTALDAIITSLRVWSTVARGIIRAAMQVLRGDFKLAFNTIKKTVFKVLTIVANFFKRTFSGIIRFINQWGSKLLAIVTPLFNSIVTFIRKKLNGVISFITKWGKLALKVILAPFYLVYIGIKRILTGIFNTIIKPFLNRIKKVWARHGDAILREARTAWNNISSTVMNILTTVFSFISDIASRIIRKLRTAWFIIRSHTIVVWNAISSRLKTVWSIIESVVTTALDVITPYVTRAWNTIKSASQTAWNIILSVVTSVISRLRGIITAGISLIRTVWNQGLNVIRATTAAIWKGIQGIFEFAVDFILTTVRAALNILNGDTRTALNLFKDLWDRTLNGIQEFINTWVSDAITAISNALDDIISEFISFGNELIWGSIIPRMLNAMENEFGGFIDWLTGKVSTLVDNVTGSFESMKSGITDAFSSAKQNAIDEMSSMKSRVESIISSVVGSVDDALSSIQDTADSMISEAQDAVDEATSILNDSSSSDSTTDYQDDGGRQDRTSDDSTSTDTTTDYTSDFTTSSTGFAHGGIVTEPTRAVIGEAGDDEAVIPLNSRGADFMSRVMGAAGGGTKVEVQNIHASGYAEGRAAARGLKDELRSQNFD